MTAELLLLSQALVVHSGINDIIAGITLAMVRIPQGMAYGLLAGAAPQFGLYTELFTCVFYTE